MLWIVKELCLAQAGTWFHPFLSALFVIRSPQRSKIVPLHPLLRRVAKKIRSLFLKPPEDPHEYAMVTAPVRPKLPALSAKAAVVPERYASN